MKPSNRLKILEAAVRVINRDGIGALTFESVAAEAELTRGGLLYHFPSREELIRGINEHLMALWEADLEKLAGQAADQAPLHERYAAYARASAQSATRAELQFMLESAAEGPERAPWFPVLQRWAPPAPVDESDPLAMNRFIARLAADGLWIYESMSHGKLSEKVRAEVAERIAEVFERNRE